MKQRIIVAGATDLTGVTVTRVVMAADNMELGGAVARLTSPPPPAWDRFVGRWGFHEYRKRKCDGMSSLFRHSPILQDGNKLLDRLTGGVGGPSVFAKFDNCTGLAFGR